MIRRLRNELIGGSHCAMAGLSRTGRRTPRRIRTLRPTLRPTLKKDGRWFEIHPEHGVPRTASILAPVALLFPVHRVWSRRDHYAPVVGSESQPGRRSRGALAADR